MKEAIIRHLMKVRNPKLLEESWPQEAMPIPEGQKPAMPPQQPQPQGGAPLSKGALESFLPSANQEFNPEVPLEEAGALPGISFDKGRFGDALKRKRMGMQNTSQRGKLTYG